MPGLKGTVADKRGPAPQLVTLHMLPLRWWDFRGRSQGQTICGLEGSVLVALWSRRVLVTAGHGRTNIQHVNENRYEQNTEHTRVCTHAHTRARARTHACTRTHARARTHTHTHKHTNTRTHTCTHAHNWGWRGAIQWQLMSVDCSVRSRRFPSVQPEHAHAPVGQPSLLGGQACAELWSLCNHNSTTALCSWPCSNSSSLLPSRSPILLTKTLSS